MLNKRVVWCVYFLAFALGLTSRPAHAFLKGCHQSITTEALRANTWPQGESPPATTADDVMMAHEFSVDVAPEVLNAWAMAVLVGNQYNDQGAADLKDVVAAANLSARPELQREHCLRGPDDDGATGTASALAAAKAFMLEQLALALGDADVPDLQAQETVRMHLVFRGPSDVPLNRYAFHMGRAIHAMQDSFPHTFRDHADRARVKTVLNWVDWVRGGTDYDESRDGFQHVNALDQCDPHNTDDVERVDAARQATKDLLAAVADDTGGRAGRLSRAAAAIDKWFVVVPGCTAANTWCDAPEVALSNSSGCTAGGKAASGPLALIAFLAVALLVLRRRRLALAVVLLSAMASPAFAAAPLAAEATAVAETVEAGEKQAIIVNKPFGIAMKGAFAVDNGGWAVGGGLRYDLSKWFTIGAEAEYNPWISFETNRSTSGATNAYATGIFRINVRDSLELRISGSAGVSIINFETFAARKGTAGAYLAVSPLSVAIRLGTVVRLLLDPGELVLAAPQTRGIPLLYSQHRFTIGLQLNLF
jgi:MYXO-CTERM domain-containing protein